jgi:prepilin-type N-terminal cleavage/methylation domain-containing protein
MHCRVRIASGRRVLNMARAIARRARVRSSSEAGFTLPELLIGLMIGLIVLGGAVMVFTAGIHTQSSLGSRAAQIQQARTTADQVVRELRQGGKVTTAGTSLLTFVTYVHATACDGSSSASAAAIPCQVTYSCSSATCTRTVRSTNGTGSSAARTVVTGLSTSTVFSYSPSAAAPRYVGVRFTFAPQSGQSGVTVDDGAALNNLPVQ